MSSVNNDTVGCAPAAPGLLPNSPGQVAALVLTIVFPCAVCGMLFILWWFRETSVYLRKRHFGLTVISAIMTSICWSVTCLYDYLGPQAYPCWLFMLLHDIATPVVVSPVLVGLMSYISEGEFKTRIIMYEREDCLFG